MADSLTIESTVLTEEEVSLLFEIYGLPRVPYTVTMGLYGLSRLEPWILNSNGSAYDYVNVDSVAISTLLNSVNLINQVPAQVTRVKEILKEYKCISLDLSPINTDGYKMNPEKNIKNLRTKLYTYTGLVVKDSFYTNKLCIG